MYNAADWGAAEEASDHSYGYAHNSQGYGGAYGGAYAHNDGHVTHEIAVPASSAAVASLRAAGAAQPRRAYSKSAVDRRVHTALRSYLESIFFDPRGSAERFGLGGIMRYRDLADVLDACGLGPSIEGRGSGSLSPSRSSHPYGNSVSASASASSLAGGGMSPSARRNTQAYRDELWLDLHETQHRLMAMASSSSSGDGDGEEGYDGNGNRSSGGAYAYQQRLLMERRRAQRRASADASSPHTDGDDRCPYAASQPRSRSAGGGVGSPSSPTRSPSRSPRSPLRGQHQSNGYAAAADSAGSSGGGGGVFSSSSAPYAADPLSAYISSVRAFVEVMERRGAVVAARRRIEIALLRAAQGRLEAPTAATRSSSSGAAPTASVAQSNSSSTPKRGGGGEKDRRRRREVDVVTAEEAAAYDRGEAAWAAGAGGYYGHSNGGASNGNGNGESVEALASTKLKGYISSSTSTSAAPPQKAGNRPRPPLPAGLSPSSLTSPLSPAAVAHTNTPSPTSATIANNGHLQPSYANAFSSDGRGVWGRDGGDNGGEEEREVSEQRPSDDDDDEEYYGHGGDHYHRHRRASVSPPSPVAAAAGGSNRGGYAGMYSGRRSASPSSPTSPAASPTEGTNSHRPPQSPLSLPAGLPPKSPSSRRKGDDRHRRHSRHHSEGEEGGGGGDDSNDGRSSGQHRPARRIIAAPRRVVTATERGGNNNNGATYGNNNNGEANSPHSRSIHNDADFDAFYSRSGNGNGGSPHRRRGEGGAGAEAEGCGRTSPTLSQLSTMSSSPQHNTTNGSAGGWDDKENDLTAINNALHGGGANTKKTGILTRSSTTVLATAPTARLNQRRQQQSQKAALSSRASNGDASSSATAPSTTATVDTDAFARLYNKAVAQQRHRAKARAWRAEGVLGGGAGGSIGAEGPHGPNAAASAAQQSLRGGRQWDAQQQSAEKGRGMGGNSRSVSPCDAAYTTTPRRRRPSHQASRNAQLKPYGLTAAAAAGALTTTTSGAATYAAAYADAYAEDMVRTDSDAAAYAAMPRGLRGAEAARVERERQALLDCTFAPRISAVSRALAAVGERRSGTPSGERSRAFTASRLSSVEADARQAASEAAREAAELEHCTFAPTIRSNPTPAPSDHVPPFYVETVSRLRTGVLERRRRPPRFGEEGYLRPSGYASAHDEKDMRTIDEARRTYRRTGEAPTPPLSDADEAYWEQKPVLRLKTGDGTVHDICVSSRGGSRSSSVHNPVSVY